MSVWKDGINERQESRLESIDIKLLRIKNKHNYYFYKIRLYIKMLTLLKQPCFHISLQMKTMNNNKVDFTFLIIPVKIINFVPPLRDIPAQTWILYGCLILGFNLTKECLRQKHNLECRSIQMLLLSVNITLSKSSFVTMHSKAKLSGISQLIGRIAWQYLGPLWIQGSFFL